MIADPYRQRNDRAPYDNYDDYPDGSFAAYGAAAGLPLVDFTEADGETLVKPRETFEDDMSAS